MNNLLRVISHETLSCEDIKTIHKGLGINVPLPSVHNSYAANDLAYSPGQGISTVRNRVLKILDEKAIDVELRKNLASRLGRIKVMQSIDFLLSNLAIALSHANKYSSNGTRKTVHYASVVLRNGSSCYKQRVAGYAHNLSYRVTLRVLKQLDQLRIVEYNPGFHNPKTKISQASRLGACKDLEDWLFEAGCISLSRTARSNRFTVTLKKHQGVYEEVTDDESLEPLNQLNAMLQEGHITLSLKNIDEYRECYQHNLSDTAFVYRLYSQYVGNQGRFWHRYTSCPRIYRDRIQINGKPTIELDYQASQVNIAYSLLKLHADDHVTGDLYNPNGMSLGTRDLRKAVFSRSTSTSQVINSIHQSFPQYNRDYIRDIRDEFWYHHQNISYFNHSNAHKELVFNESLIALEVIRQCIEHKIIVLPIHDSFIVEASNGDLLRQFMHDAYPRLGFTSIPKIEKK